MLTGLQLPIVCLAVPHGCTNNNLWVLLHTLCAPSLLKVEVSAQGMVGRSSCDA